MVKYILALSLIASTARANVASDGETKQKQEQKSRDLVGGVPANFPTYWPTYWPTYSPTEEYEEPEHSYGEKASAGYAEEVKETRYYSSPPPPPPSGHYSSPPPPPPPVETGSPTSWGAATTSESALSWDGPTSSWGSTTTLESATSWDTAPMWDDDGWDTDTASESTTSWDVAPMWDDDAWESLPSSKAGKMGKRSKCSKRGKVSIFNIIRTHIACDDCQQQVFLTRVFLRCHLQFYRVDGGKPPKQPLKIGRLMTGRNLNGTRLLNGSNPSGVLTAH